MALRVGRPSPQEQKINTIIDDNIINNNITIDAYCATWTKIRTRGAHRRIMRGEYVCVCE